MWKPGQLCQEDREGDPRHHDHRRDAAGKERSVAKAHSRSLSTASGIGKNSLADQRFSAQRQPLRVSARRRTTDDTDEHGWDDLIRGIRGFIAFAVVRFGATASRH
jgi:hypothetical protein